MKDRNCDQRANSALTARFRIEQQLRIYIVAAENLPGAKASRAQSFLHGNFGSSRKRQQASTRPVLGVLAIEDSRGGAARPGDVGQTLDNHRERLLERQMLGSNLLLGFDDLRQRETLIILLCRFLRLRLWRGLRWNHSCRVFRGERFLFFLELLFFLQFEIVLLQHKGRFQNLCEGLLVVNRFVFFLGHDLLFQQCEPSGAQTGRRYPILVHVPVQARA